MHILASDGWITPLGTMPAKPEDVLANIDQICDLTHYHAPMTVYDEFNAVAAAARRQGVR